LESLYEDIRNFERELQLAEFARSDAMVASAAFSLAHPLKRPEFIAGSSEVATSRDLHRHAANRPLVRSRLPLTR
jgi:hypothetical protein